MVPSMLFTFFIVLFATVLVASGVVSWPVGILLGIAMLWLERKLFAASHSTDGDDASDEPHEHVHPASPEDLAPPHDRPAHAHVRSR